MTRILQLEDGPNYRKQGVDDFLAGGGTVEDLRRLTEDYSPEVFALEEKPVLAEEALYGLPGDVVRTIKDHTEADPVAILMEFLSRAGNLIGRGAHFIVEGDTHYMKINYVSVGSTSKGRKGTASGRIDRVMEQVDQWWVDNCVDTGLSSGEGLIKRIADKNPPKDEDSDEEDDGEDFDPGEVEKRLYVQEPEFGSMLTVMAREGNSLSSVIRNAWDDRPLRSMVKKDPMQSTNSHVTIVGHVTKEELLKHLTESKLGYGIANRFLFMMVSRSKQLPYGGEQNLFTKAFIKQLKAAIKFAKTPRRVDFCKDPEDEYDGISAYDYWGDVYGELSEDRQFLLGSIISRAESQVRRIATLYAVLDKSEVVRMAHLEAALAVWAYAEDSANLLFGDKTGYRQVDDVLRVIRAHGEDGCRKTRIHETLGNNVLVRRIDQILEDLEKAGWIYHEKEDIEGKRGRRAELWFPVTG